jgi:hypothetical protein
MPSIARYLSFAAVIAAVAVGVRDVACAQGQLDATYTISMARIPVGKAAWTVVTTADQYGTTATGSASGILSALVSGEGSLAATGSIKDGRLVPASFTSLLVREDETASVRMLLEGGNVTELVAEKLPSDLDRVPVMPAHRQGILDPLTALLIPVPGSGEVVVAQVCQRTLPIFDGRRRYDFGLAFKRMDKVKADKGYQGAVVVCSIAFQPIAGHRAGSLLVKYLSQGREIEIWLAPIAGTRVLAPFRLAVENLIGNIVVQASRFETTAVTQRLQ